MKQRLIYGGVIVLLALNLALGAQVYFTSAAAAQKDSAYPNLELFSYVLEKVRRDYVDGTNLTYQQLVYGALRGMVDTLDPHSEFLTPDRFKELQNDTQGQFGGLGVVIQNRDGFITVVAPIEDTPGFRAGIKAGDRLLKINDQNAEGMALEDAVQLLRGKPDTQVRLTLLRPATGETREYELARAVINVAMTKDVNGRQEYPLLDGQIGYVRLTQFGDRTSAELDRALKKLRAEGMQALILDLRDNPGGLLDQAVEVCERFLPRGLLVVTTEGRNNKKERRMTSRAGAYRDLPLAVLINYNSASAAEIVSGCLQDYTATRRCKAVLIGETTFGKGSVQEILPLAGDAALRLTTSKYYTPSHKVIHEHGITPDIVVPMSDVDETFSRLRMSPGGIAAAPEAEQNRLRDARDRQLERAEDVLKGILLFTARNDSHPPRNSGRLMARGEQSEASAE